MNNFLVTLLLMYFSLFGMTNIQDPTPIYSVQQGLDEIRAEFPDWHDRYEYGEFDCSEMSSFVVSYFRIHGFDAKLHRGKIEKKKNKSHVWITVNGVTVECTTLKIKKGIEHYKEYYKPFDSSKTIYPVVTAIDWWNSKYIQDKMGDKFTLYLMDNKQFKELYKKDDFVWEKYNG